MQTTVKKLNNFKISKNLLNKNVAIEFFNKKQNKIYTYEHDVVYNAMISKLETLACFTKYNSYTSSNSIPTLAKPFVTVVESTNDLRTAA